MCHVPILINFGKEFSMILCLNLLILDVDFSSDGRPFDVLGPRFVWYCFSEIEGLVTFTKITVIVCIQWLDCQ